MWSFQCLHLKRLFMNQKYTDLGDLWCEWPEATAAIMAHIEKNEPLQGKSSWGFRQGSVVVRHDNGYSVSTSHSAYDPWVKSIVILYVQANVTDSDEMIVRTNKREAVQE